MRDLDGTSLFAIVAKRLEEAERDALFEILRRYTEALSALGDARRDVVRARMELALGQVAFVQGGVLVEDRAA